MSKFTMERSEISRLKVLNDYIKKMESVSPIDENLLFVLDSNKLNIYGNGNSSFIKMDLDIKNPTITDIYFILNLGKFILFSEKVDGDNIEINFDNTKSQAIFKGSSSKTSYKTVISASLDAQQVTEKQNHIKNILSMQDFVNPITIDMTGYSDIISSLGSLTKIIGINNNMLIQPDKIKTGDNVCVISYSVPNKKITSKDFYLNKNIAPLFKGTEIFQLSASLEYYYFDIVKNGIKLIFVQKEKDFAFPDDQDIIDQSPVSSQQIEVEINAKHFYEQLDKFDGGVFDSSTWKYHELRFITPKGFSDKIELNFDNMQNTVDTELFVKIINRTDTNEGFSLLLPTTHFAYLKEILYKDENSVFTIIYDSVQPGNPERNGVRIKNSEVDIMLAKMVAA